MKRKTDEAGIDFITEQEGYELQRYKDSAGLWTIGVGHLIKPGEHLTSITREQAEKLLRDDLAETEEAINHLVRVPLNQNEFNALVSLAFNIGVGRKGFAGSSLLRFLNAGDYTGAANQFVRWNRAGGRVVNGLTERRLREKKLFLTPDDSEEEITRFDLPDEDTEAESVPKWFPEIAGGPIVPGKPRVPPPPPVGKLPPSVPQGLPPAPVAAPVVNVEQKNVESSPSPIVKTASEQVTLIASSGLTRLGKRLSTGTLSTGALATVTAFAERNWILLAFASLLIVVGFVIFLVIYRSKHKEKLVEADIRSDASRFNVAFEK
jgi:lysozyme